ncbi:MAG: NTP transferase domain-containing protein [Clostridia bacterium]|nr:NTP transferase domain-containing protein [Clostridia bacterium]
MDQQTRFDSVIIAGGFGKRLSPLTDALPKPMLPIAGESLFTRNLKLLRKHGFGRTAVTTMYLAEKLENADCGEGVTEFFREEKPLGSAGALGAIKSRFDDVILVISGDAVFDYDLSEARKKFLESKCDAAILLCRTEDTGEYGSVCVENGKICGFCEKPSCRDTLSDLVNTGIYFLSKSAFELIPEDRRFDFSRDLFPMLLRSGKCIAGLELQGHWFDIGTFGDYHRCNLWVNDGKSCIGRHTSIHPNAKIEHCVIMDNVTVGNSVLRGCIVGENAIIGNDCIIPPGCVIGPGAELRDGTPLAPSTVVETGCALAGESHYDYFPKPRADFKMDDDYIIADTDDEGFFVRLGKMLGSGNRLFAFAEGSGMTLPRACELACGAAESGSNCTVISGGNASAAAFAASEYGNKTAFISEEDGKTAIRLYSEFGMPYSREELRALAEKTPSNADRAGSVYLLPHGALVKRYLSHLNSFTSPPKRFNAAGGAQNRFLRECAEELGLSEDIGGAVYVISPDGERAKAIMPDGREISYWQLLAICCIEGKRSGILLPRDTPDTLERILKRHSVDIGFYGDSESEERTLAASDRLPRDGVLLALTAASLAEKNGVSIAELADRLPPFSVTTRSVYADSGKMISVISRLRRDNRNGRSAGFDFGEGRVSVYPSAAGRFRIIAEAVNAETAEEISLKAAEMLEKDEF